MLKMFTTQLTGLFKRLEEKEEFSLEDGARLLAQAPVGDGAIYILGTKEMKAVEFEALDGAEPPKWARALTLDGVSGLSDADRVLMFARTSVDEEAVMVAGQLLEKGIPFVAVSTVMGSAGGGTARPVGVSVGAESGVTDAAGVSVGAESGVTDAAGGSVGAESGVTGAAGGSVGAESGVSVAGGISVGAESGTLTTGAGLTQTHGISIGAESGITASDAGLQGLADVHIDLRLTKGLLPDDLGNRYGYPSGIAALFVYHGLKFTIDEILEEYED